METTNEPSSSGEVSQEAGLLESATIATTQDEGQAVNKVEINHMAEDPNAAPQNDDDPLERPDWWPENFWKKDDSEPDLEAIAKSWTDLRKQISQGKHKAPVDGKYDTSVFKDIPDEDPIKSHVITWAKEYGVSQGALDALVSQVVEMGGIQQQGAKLNLEKERAALGPNADATIQGMVQWASGLVQKGIWGSDDFEEFKIMGGTAQGIKALMKLRSAYEGRIPTQSAPVSGAPSKDELYAMVGDPKYQTDPAYRAKVERMFQSSFSQ